MLCLDRLSNKAAVPIVIVIIVLMVISLVSLSLYVFYSRSDKFRLTTGGISEMINLYSKVALIDFYIQEVVDRGFYGDTKEEVAASLRGNLSLFKENDKFILSELGEVYDLIKSENIDLVDKSLHVFLIVKSNNEDSFRDMKVEYIFDKIFKKSQ